jgi:hypothetical protein
MNTAVDISAVPAELQKLFQQGVTYVMRKYTFVPGQRDTFLFNLGNYLYRKDMPQDTATLLANQRFGGEPDIDVAAILNNAYTYTSQTDRQKAESAKPPLIRAEEYLTERYLFRRNIVLNTLEYKKKRTKTYTPIQTPFYNDFYRELYRAGIYLQASQVRNIINSSVAKDYDPFEEYFYNLPPWDGETDHIGALSETMTTDAPKFWSDCFRRWMVGLVACALSPEKQNQLALILRGAQGTGKSTWVRNLLPPPLSVYYRNGMLNPSNKDHLLLLSECLIINLEEFEGMKAGSIGELKRIITQDNVTERRAYAEERGVYVRRASFIASTNEPRFLQDISGTRRFPTFTALSVDYKRPVDHDNVYSQALSLWKSGFHYWFEGEELSRLNTHNAKYVVASQELELFYRYFAKPDDWRFSPVRWMTAAEIQAYLVIMGKLRSDTRGQKEIIKILERDEFQVRMTEQGIYEYMVLMREGGGTV